MKVFFTSLFFLFFISNNHAQVIATPNKLELSFDLSKPLFHGFGASIEYLFRPRLGFELGYNIIKIDRIRPNFSFSSRNSGTPLKYDKQSVYLNYKVYSKRSTHNAGKFGGIYIRYKSSQSDRIVNGDQAYWNDIIIGLNRGYKKMFKNQISFALTIGSGIVFYSSSNTLDGTVDTVIEDIPLELYGQAQIAYRF